MSRSQSKLMTLVMVVTLSLAGLAGCAENTGFPCMRCGSTCAAGGSCDLRLAVVERGSGSRASGATHSPMGTESNGYGRLRATGPFGLAAVCLLR